MEKLLRVYYNHFKEEIITKGTKFTQKLLEKFDLCERKS